MKIRREVILTMTGFVVYELVVSPMRWDVVLHEHLAEEFFQGPPHSVTTSVTTASGIITTTTTTAP